MLNSGTVTKGSFGNTAEGLSVELFSLRNSKGLEAKIMTYGGIVASLKVPDRNGNLGDVVLGFDELADYQKFSPYFGALIGRFGNRIGRAQFSLDGQLYKLAANNGANTLHGGVKGFDKVVWRVGHASVGVNGPELELIYISKDGEEGFPGALTVHATYTVTEDNALRLDFKATTDKPTVCNLTHHSYFNLCGRGNVLDHVVTIYADKFTPVDGGLIPTGELRPVVGTPFDFTKPTAIGARIASDDEQIKLAKGYDHNWVLNTTQPGTLAQAASVKEASSGRVIEVWTTEPGVQFYSGNFLDGSIIGKGGRTYEFRGGLCFEPQHFPDTPNQPTFPTATLLPGQTYQNTIIYKFSVC